MSTERLSFRERKEKLPAKEEENIHTRRSNIWKESFEAKELGSLTLNGPRREARCPSTSRRLTSAGETASSKKKKQVFSKNRQLPLSRDFSPGGGYKESNNSSKDRLDIARGANTRRYASHVFGGERDKLGPIRLAASRGAVKENHFTPGYTPFHPCENSRSFRVSLASHPSLAVYLPPFFFFFLPTFSRLSFPIHPRFPAPRYAMLVCLDENLEKKKKGGEE